MLPDSLHAYLVFLSALLESKPIWTGTCYVLFTTQCLVWSCCAINICRINEWICKLLTLWLAPHLHEVPTWGLFSSWYQIPGIFSDTTSFIIQHQLGVQQFNAIWQHLPGISVRPHELKGSVQDCSPVQTQSLPAFSCCVTLPAPLCAQQCGCSLNPII